MPPLETKDLNESAVVWIFQAYDRNAEPLCSPPVQIPVRWERAQKEIADAMGTKLTIDVELATNLDVPLNSILWYGTLAQVRANPPAQDIYEAIYRIHAFDLKTRYNRWEGGLRRYKNVIPKTV